MDGDKFPFDQFFTGGGAVPEVDPSDLDAVLELCGGGVQPSRDQPKATGSSLFEQVCSPGADVFSVFYRSAMLQLMGGLNLLSPWLHDGVLDKAVIRVAATFPMEKMDVGVVRSSLPFDLEEFVKQIKAAAGD